ncbi:MAG: AMP-binding protein [Cyanobacteria bacterium]|nr:AMP-binding protein [Cyanobacteriota bacterium]
MDSEQFWSLCRDLLKTLQTDQPRDILLVTADPVEAIASVIAAFLVPTCLWLGNPTWGQQEWQQVVTQMQPDLIWGQFPEGIWRQDKEDLGASRASNSQHRDQTQLLIPTGGSSGDLKFAIHTWDTLMAAVRGFQQHFQPEHPQSPNLSNPPIPPVGAQGFAPCDPDGLVVNAYCVLPMYHVSGLMQALRCWASGGTLMLQSFRSLRQQPLDVSVQGAFLSLVPTQLQRLLEDGYGDWLRQFRAILLGGAAPWPGLLNQARQQQLPLAPTYGMTETAAQVATLLPHEFLAGQNSSGRSLPHVTLTIQSLTGEPLSSNQVGLITIQSPSLALGNCDASQRGAFQPGDLGSLDKAGYLTVLGRQGTLINTGGEKVLPEEVEAAIRATGLVMDVVVVGLPDADWGNVVTAIVVPTPTYSLAVLRQGLRDQLSPYKHPKYWLCREALPRNGQGKLNRHQLQDWAQQQLPHGGAATAVTGVAAGCDGDRGQ